MSDNVINIFDRINSPKKAIDTADGQTSKEKETYKAVELEKRDRRVLRLQINFSDGGIDLCSYAQLADIYSASSNYISLIFTSGIVYMEGENLRALLPDFQQERILTIQPFDPNQHKTPEKGMAVIHRIDWRVPEQVQGKNDSH